MPDYLAGCRTSLSLAIWAGCNLKKLATIFSTSGPGRGLTESPALLVSARKPGSFIVAMNPLRKSSNLSFGVPGAYSRWPKVLGRLIDERVVICHDI